MRANLILGAMCLTALVLGGCACWNRDGGSPVQQIRRTDAQVVSTLLDRKVDLTRTDGCDYSALVGAFRDEGAVVGRASFDTSGGTTRNPHDPNRYPSMASNAETSLDSRSRDTGVPEWNGGDANVELKSGWIYVIRPPAWPIVRTPRIRGGVPLTSEAAGTVLHVLAYADGEYERIFLLGASDGNGNPVNPSFTFRVEAYTSSSTGFVTLHVGEYAEIHLDPTASPAWGAVQGPVSISGLPPGSEIAVFLEYVRNRVLNAGMAWNSGLVIP